MRVEKARPGARGIDCVTTLDAAACARLKAAGAEFCIRYVKDLRAMELEAILSSGLALMFVSHVRYPGWRPSSGMGHIDGMNLIFAMKALAIPTGATLWIDVEGVASDVPAQDVLDYTNMCGDMIVKGGYEPGLYNGFGTNLNGQQLYHGLKLGLYWKAYNAQWTPAVRGYCLLQEIPPDVMFAGVRVDHDVVQLDDLGDVPSWVVAD